VASEYQPLDELAEAVLLGSPVDWASAESSAGEPHREAVRQLRVLAAIAELHRRVDHEVAEEAPRLDRWGRLQLLDSIGRGSFGEVYRAWDPKLDREVAVKLLKTDRFPEGATVLSEARLMARVRHPNVVTVYDADEIDGRVGLWMEFIHGRNLEEALREKTRFDDREVTRVGIELCRALSAVHDAGLLHRDIKAQNLMRTADGRLVLMDFGTGRELEETASSSMDAAGTPLYLAPEIFFAEAATVRSDIYSTGVLLFHLLTGTYPVRGATVKEVGEAHARGERMDLAARAPKGDKALAAVIGRAIQPDPLRRFESARAMLRALEGVQGKSEAQKRKPYWFALGVVSLAAVVLAVVPSLNRHGGRSGGAPYFGTTAQKRAVQMPRVFSAGKPSADERYLPYSEFETGNLALYEFATGTSRVLTKGGDAGNYYAVAGVMSPDDSRIAYSWIDGGFDRVQLRVIGTDGTNERTLDSSPNPTSITPLKWSSDGAMILGTRQRSDGETEVILVSASDGSIRVVLTLPFRPGNVDLSPDGRYVAYDRAENSNDTDRGIYLSTVDGGAEFPIVTGPTYDSHPLWMADGSALVFASLRTGGPDLWLQPIKDGHAEGRPRLIDKDMGPFRPITLTNRGSLFYDHRIGLMDVYTVPIDPGSGQVIGEPTNAAASHLGSNLAADWSPDGKALVFASWRTLFGPGGNILVFHSMDTGQDREVAVDMGGINGPLWSPDGRFIAVIGPDRKGVRALRLIDPQSGRIVSTFFPMPGDAPPVAPLAWDSDGRHLYLSRHGKKGIQRFDVYTGDEEFVYETPPDVTGRGLSLSPDGRWFAMPVIYPKDKSVGVWAVPTTGGNERRLVTFPANGAALRLGGWTRDGRHVLFVRVQPANAERKQIGELWAVPFDGGPARSVGLSMPALRDVRVSPDGTRVSFTTGFPDREMWVFENFLPSASK
jgi:Tol biopolymer transport system component/tRNA A-37 threonylcarbamoyl transferase component Bud32